MVQTANGKQRAGVLLAPAARFAGKTTWYLSSLQSCLFRRYGIEPAVVPRAALGQPDNGQTYSLKRAVHRDGFMGIARAGRLKAAAPSKMRPNRHRIQIDQSEKQPGEDTHGAKTKKPKCQKQTFCSFLHVAREGRNEVSYFKFPISLRSRSSNPFQSSMGLRISKKSWPFSGKICLFRR